MQASGICYNAETMNTQRNEPRKPTEEEKTQLVDFALRDQDPELFDLGKVADEEREQIKGHVDDAYIAVFDHYITSSPGYTGKVMVVVWSSAPQQTEVFTWSHGHLEQEPITK